MGHLPGTSVNFSSDSLGHFECSDIPDGIAIHKPTHHGPCSLSIFPSDSRTDIVIHETPKVAARACLDSVSEGLCSLPAPPPPESCCWLSV